MERFCAGCGVFVGEFFMATEGWHEFCGACNERYYSSQESEEVKRGKLWTRMVEKYGEDLAGEIWADGNM